MVGKALVFAIKVTNYSVMGKSMQTKWKNAEMTNLYNCNPRQKNAETQGKIQNRNLQNPFFSYDGTVEFN